MAARSSSTVTGPLTMPIDAAQVKWDSAPAAIDPAAVKWDDSDVKAVAPITPVTASPVASNTSFIDMLDKKLDPLRQAIGQGPVKVNPDNYQTSALDQARSTFRFNAAKATPAQAQDPAFSAKLLGDAAAEFGVPASQIAQADDQTSHFVPTGSPAASAAFMSGAAKPIVDAMGVVPLVAGGVASLGGLAPNAASDALFSAHDTLQRSGANGGEQDMARSQVAGQLGELGSSVAMFMALPEARGLHIAERMASGSDLASRLAPFAEHAAANLPRAIAAGGITQGVSGADAVLNHGGDVSQALGEYAVGLGGGTAQFVAPVSLGGGWVSRMAAGTVSQQALQQGTADAQHHIDPVAFPQGAQPFDPKNPMDYLGGALGLFGGRGGDRGGFGKDFNDYVAGQRSGELGADATARGASPINPQPVGPDALALPRGADFTARAEPIRPAPVDLGGAVRVGASGEAATPQQGAAALGDAITAGSTGNPALPAPVIKVDKTGQAMDSRAENQSFIDQAKSALADSQTRSRLDQLGLTPDIEKIITKAQDRNAASLPEPTDSSIAKRDNGIIPDQSRTAIPPEPRLPVPAYDATPTELSAHADAVESRSRDVENAVLGDRADAWRKAQRQSNSNDDVRARAGSNKISDIEQTLHPKDVEALYGVGETSEGNDGFEDFRDAHERADARSPDEAAGAIASFLPKLGNTKGTDPSVWTREQQVAYAGMRSVRERINDAGWDSSAIQKRALLMAASKYSDANDAGFMLHRFLDPKQTAKQAVPALDAPTAKERNTAAVAGRDAERNGLGRDLVPPSGGKGDLFAGPRPEQGGIGDPAFSFAGERALTADRGELSRAQQMEAAGRDSVPDRNGNLPGSPEETHVATGWHKGADGKWRFEIDDSEAKINHAALNDPKDSMVLGDVMRHSDMYEAYPDLKNIAVKVDPSLKAFGQTSADGKTITLRDPTQYAATGEKSLKSVLLHEVQHVIQTDEGFGRGGNREEFMKPRIAEKKLLYSRIDAINRLLSKASREGQKAKYSALLTERQKIVSELQEKHLDSDMDILSRSHKDYTNLSGEVESRNTQARMDMTAAERRALPPSETADIPRNQQTVRFNSQPGDAGVRARESNEAFDTINNRLSKLVGGEVIFRPSDNVPHSLSLALDAWDAAFGGETHVITNETPGVLDLQGVTLRDGHRFVNEDSDAPLLNVAAHETSHQMEKDRPDLFNELADHMEKNGDIDRYLHDVNQSNAKHGTPDLSREGAKRELVADAMGDAMGDPEFIERLAKQNPSLFRRVADYFKTALDKVLSRLKDLGSSKYLKDVQAFRDKLADVLERYAGDRARADGESHDVAFSRKPDAHETESVRDMPSRRPGESQSEYVARIYRKSGDEIKAATALAKNDRKLGRYAVRAYAAKNARNMDIADAAMKQARQLFDKTPDVINYASVDQWERGERIDDADFRHFISMMKEGFDQRIEAIHELAPGALETLIEQYMPHMYEDTGKALKWYQTTMGKKPMQGDKSFLKQRTWPTLKEAMASGLRPISPNPVDWVMMKYQQMDKFIHMLQLIKGMKERGWIMKLDPGQRAPEGFTVPDDAAFLIASGLQGRLAIPEMIAKDLNNYLTPGLSKYGAWRSLRAVQNAMVSWNLGWSAFHAGFTSIDNAVTHGAVGLQRLADGDIKGGLATLVKSVPTMLLSPLEGARLNREFRHMPASGLDRLSGKVPALDKMIFGNTFDDPNVHAILDALTEGGARFKMGAASAEYNNALPRVLRTIRRMQAPGWLSDSLDGVKRTARTNTALENVKGAVTAGPKALGSALSAIGEVSSFLIHHVLVPNQKMAARVMLMKFELDHAAGDMRARGYDVEKGDYAKIIDIMHPDVLKQLASDVVDKVDFRLGQMTYDNFFYPKVARELAQLVVMAPGWQAGAFQTMTGGLRDIGRLVKPEKLVAPSLDKEGRVTDAHRPRFTNNVANLIMLFVMVGGANALYQYLVTGKDADDPRDFVGPRIGGKNPDDSDRRVMAPSYMKDHYEFFHDFPHGAIAMGSHKLHPFWRDMWELTHNQDYFGVRIRNEYGPKMDQVEDVAKYLLKSMMPFTVKNSQKIHEDTVAAGSKSDPEIARNVASFVGVTPAPASFARTEFQQFVAGNGTKGYDNAVRTPEQAALTKAKRTAEDQIRAGGSPDLSSFDPRARRDVLRQANQLVPEVRFSKMSIDDKLRGYDMATPAERTRYHLAQQIERSNVRKSVAFQRMSDEERQSIIDRIAQIRKEGSSSE